MRTLWTCLTVLILAGLAAADCTVRHRVATVAPAVAVVKKEVAVITPVIAPIAVFAPVPLYGAAYAPPIATPAPATTSTAAPQSDLKAILDAVQALDRRLQAIEKGGPTVAPKGPDPFNPGPLPKAGAVQAGPPAAFTAKCAACHEAGVAADQGGGFTLLEGTALAKLSDRQIRKVLSASYSGRMPPKGHAPLTDDEVGRIVAYLDSLK